MISAGMARAAVAYSSPYAELEKTARSQRKGFWRDDVETPWQFRERRAQEVSALAPRGCVFKAVNDRAGRRTLFAPWSPWSFKVQVNERKGGRWFCSEADAVAAGWNEPRWLMGSIVSGVYNP